MSGPQSRKRERNNKNRVRGKEANEEIKKETERGGEKETGGFFMPYNVCGGY